MQSGYGRFQSGGQPGVTPNTIDAAQELGSEKWIFRNVDSKAGGVHNVVNQAIDSVISRYAKPPANRHSRFASHTDRYGHELDPGMQPSGASGPDRPPVGPILERTRQLAKLTRPRDQLAEPRGPYIPWRIQQTAQWLDLGYSSFPAKPMNLRLADHNLNVGPGLMQQRRRFQRTLAPADHQNAFTGKAREIALVGAMRSQFGRQIFQFRRTRGKRSNSSRDHDAIGAQKISVFGGLAKSTSLLGNAGNLARVKIGN